MWLNKFKIAIVNQDTDAIDRLLNEMPKFSDVSDMQEAKYLLKEATSLMERLKDKTKSSMKQIKQNINFLKSTQANTKSTLDIRS